jgi:general secretion pathway protein L
MRLGPAAARFSLVANRFFAWWGQELMACVPTRLRRALKPRRDALIFDLGDDEVVVSRTNGNGATELVRLPRASLDGAARPIALPGNGSSLDRRRLSIVIRLPRTRALRRSLELPAAAVENIRQVLTFDMDRQTPFKADDVYFDCAVAAVDRLTQRVPVELVVVPRAVVDRALALVRGQGFAPTRVDIAWEPDTGPSVNLLPAAERPPHPRLAGRLSFALGILVAVLVAALVYIPFARLNQQTAAVAAEVDVARRQADAGRKVQEDFDAMVRQSRFLADKRVARPLVVEMMAEITRLCPDDTWLSRMRLTGTEVQTFGFSPSASALIGTLDASPLFESPQFRAPLTRDPRVEAERFHIALQVVKPAEP